MKAGYIEREDPIMDVCDNMIYIMPIREPMERICSQSSQFNPVDNIFSDQSLFRSYDSWYNIHKNDNETDNSCIASNVTINDKVWKRLTKAIDYKGFFKELLQSDSSRDLIHYLEPIDSHSTKEDVVHRLNQVMVKMKD